MILFWRRRPLHLLAASCAASPRADYHLNHCYYIINNNTGADEGNNNNNNNNNCHCLFGACLPASFARPIASRRMAAALGAGQPTAKAPRWIRANQINADEREKVQYIKDKESVVSESLGRNQCRAPKVAAACLIIA